jgi:hypothetical protein
MRYESGYTGEVGKRGDREIGALKVLEHGVRSGQGGLRILRM